MKKPRRIREKPYCTKCIHKDVCGIYDALFEATVYMDKFDDYLAEGYEDELFYMLADNCNKYKPEEVIEE